MAVFFLSNSMKKAVLIFLSSFLFLSFSKETQEKALNTLLDTWHKNAAEANLEAYFELTSEDFVFLGTDPKERWTKQAFYTFCKPYFEDGKGWEFTKISRNWTFSKNGKIAWFDENLNTWMRECRGSGVFVKQKGKWKLSQYNLTVLIENEKIKDFIALRDQKAEEKK